MNSSVAIALAVLCLANGAVDAAGPASSNPSRPADRELSAYFEAETRRLTAAAFDGIKTPSDWDARRPRLRSELEQMLGLDLSAPRPSLEPVVTGQIERDDFIVQKLHFQSRPGLYVTANLHLPRPLTGRVPAILYLCGHAPVITNGVSYGNKSAYQHHGSWFARNGYACLMIDTIQLGEIQGLHHGTHRAGQWAWNSRGYSPAGVETWNAIRALDYLATRPEIDAGRLGVTGRSGGGAYSWFVAALDDRVQVAAPVAGITDLQNHVVDGCVTGHCDCMYFVNTFRWDYPLLAALVAPRPLLLANTDKDSIFPLDGVLRTHAATARIYDLLGASPRLGLLITEGPHKDTQDLQVPVLRWFNRHLRRDESPVRSVAERVLTQAELKVFDALPRDERVTRIQESFVPTAPPAPLPATAEGWARMREEWIPQLRTRVFAGWPDSPAAPTLTRLRTAERPGLRFTVGEIESQAHVPLRLYLLEPRSNGPPARIAVSVLDSTRWARWLSDTAHVFGDALRGELEQFPGARTTPAPAEPSPAILNPADGSIRVWVAPRHVGAGAWGGTERDQIHRRRRFMLLGQTLDGMQVWDIRSALRALRSDGIARQLPIDLEASGAMGVNALYAAVFEDGIRRLELGAIPASHLDTGAPDYLNVLKFLDIPQAAALVGERTDVMLRGTEADRWIYPRSVAARLGWRPAAFQIEP